MPIRRASPVTALADVRLSSRRRPPHQPRGRTATGAAMAMAMATAGAALLLAACVPAQRRPSWAIYPLPRQGPGDGLAVVNQPDGYGLHVWLGIDTRSSGICRPRWSADAARLFNGNGSAPFSSGLATRAEFFAAVARPDVRRALRQESERLCQRLEPRRSFQWLEPPRQASDLQPERWPLLEEPQLLPDPETLRQQEEQLLQGREAAAAP